MDKYRKKKKGNKKFKPNVLDDATFSFYSRIANQFNNDDFESEEVKDCMIDRILKQLSSEGLTVCKEGMVSKLAEKLIVLADIRQFHGVLRNFSRDWETACHNKLVSFVTQTLVRHSSKFFVDASILAKDDKEEEDALRKLQNEILKMLVGGLIEYLLTKFAFFMQHFSASHILRASIEALAGMKVDDAIVCGRKNFNEQNKLPPTSINSLNVEIRKVLEGTFLKICDVVVELPMMNDHVCNSLSNPVLQTFVLCLKSLPLQKSSKFLVEMIDKTKIFSKDEDDSIPGLCNHEVASHFAEQILESMSDDMFAVTYADTFKGLTPKMAASPVARFVLQKLISCCRTKEQFECIYDELQPHFESLLALNHCDVIVKISEACVKHSCKQAKFIKHISKAFHCQEPDTRRCKLVQLLLSLSTYEIFFQLPQDDKQPEIKEEIKEIKSERDSEEEKEDEDSEDEEKIDDKIGRLESINFVGSMIVQNLLRFANTSNIVGSFFELDANDWKLLCKDPCGSRVVEAFVASKKVSDKSKDVLYSKLNEHCLDIACNKFGSRTFDALWLNANEKNKKVIADELNKDPDRLKADRFGAFIFNKCVASTRKRKPSDHKGAPNKKKFSK